MIFYYLVTFIPSKKYFTQDIRSYFDFGRVTSFQTGRLCFFKSAKRHHDMGRTWHFSHIHNLRTFHAVWQTKLVLWQFCLLKRMSSFDNCMACSARSAWTPSRWRDWADIIESSQTHSLFTHNFNNHLDNLLFIFVNSIKSAMCKHKIQLKPPLWLW